MRTDKLGSPANSEDYWTREKPAESSDKLVKAIKKYWHRREAEEPGAFIKYHSNGAA